MTKSDKLHLIPGILVPLEMLLGLFDLVGFLLPLGYIVSLKRTILSALEISSVKGASAFHSAGQSKEG